jgi:hypothetical protein
LFCLGDTYLQEIFYLCLVSGAALGELCQPNLSPIPIVKKLEMVHHYINIAFIELKQIKIISKSGNHYLKKLVEPRSFASCRSRTDRNLVLSIAAVSGSSLAPVTLFLSGSLNPSTVLYLSATGTLSSSTQGLSGLDWYPQIIGIKAG